MDKIYIFLFSLVPQCIFSSGPPLVYVYKNPVENGSKLLSRFLVNYYSVSLKHFHIHITFWNQQTFYFFHRSTMRATIFNVCAILSLFTVAIHAAPGPPSVRSIPECPIKPIIGIGPVCSPRPTPTPYNN